MVLQLIPSSTSSLGTALISVSLTVFGVTVFHSGNHSGSAQLIWYCGGTIFLMFSGYFGRNTPTAPNYYRVISALKLPLPSPRDKNRYPQNAPSLLP